MNLQPSCDQPHKPGEVAIFKRRTLMRLVASLIFFLIFFNRIYAQDLLFDSDEILEIRLSGNTRSLMNERTKDAPYYPITLSYQDHGKDYQVPLKVRTRGHFRLDAANCFYPPLLLNFSKSKELPAPFTNQDKIKLVTPCKAEKYVVQEYLVYKVYNLITSKSLRARLAKVVFNDSTRGKTAQPLYGILLEEDHQMAARNGAFIIERKGIKPEATERRDFLTMAVFEYLIGNTDWSVQYQQNIELITRDSTAIPSTVAYDFDHAGIVRAPYAKPAPELRLGSTLTRRYRGFCVTDMAEFEEIFGLFNSLKDKIYAIYTGSTLLDEKYVSSTTKFLDEFYATINDPAKAKKEFLYPCDKNGTGNVVIKGLQNN